MSRHQLAPRRGKKHLTIVVGWDRPLGTYFAQVHDDHPVTPAAQSLIGRTWATLGYWMRSLAHYPRHPTDDFVFDGTSFGEITDPADAIARVAPYAIIPADLHDTLKADAEREGSRRADRLRYWPSNPPHDY